MRNMLFAMILAIVPLASHAQSSEIRFSTTRNNPTWTAAFSIQGPDIQIASDVIWFEPGIHKVRMAILDNWGMLYYAPTRYVDPTDPSTCDENVNGVCRIWYTLIISGTQIEWYWMIGTWTIQETFDADRYGPIITEHFTLTSPW